MAKRSAKAKGVHTLAIDIGGTGLKALVLSETGEALCERVRVETPKPATPDAVMTELRGIVAQLPPYDRISCGFPGVVKKGVVQTAPNLGTEAWQGFDLAVALSKAFGRPARVLNDAGVQGFGIREGKGVELVLTLGTGMGFALFIDGRYVPNVEMGHHPFRKGVTYEDWVGGPALEEVGKKRWNKRVREILAVLEPTFNPDAIYIGGGNAKRLKGELPANVHLADNLAGLLGGIALWRA